MTKKLLTLFLFIFSLCINNVYAGTTYCPIDNGVPALEKYFHDMDNQLIWLVQKILKDPDTNPQLYAQLQASGKLPADSDDSETVESPWLDNFIINSASPIVDEGETITNKTKNFVWGEGKKVFDVSKSIYRVVPDWRGYILYAGFRIGGIYYDYSIPIAIKNDIELVQIQSEKLKMYANNLIAAGIDVDPEFNNKYILGFAGLTELNDKLEYAMMGAVAKGYSTEDSVIKSADEAIAELRNYITTYSINFDTSFLETYTSIIKNEQCRQDAGPIDQIVEMWEGGFDGIFDDWTEGYDLFMGANSLGNDKAREERAKKREKEILAQTYGYDEGEDGNIDMFFDNLKNGTSLKRLNPVSDTSKQEFANFKDYLNELEDAYDKLSDKITNPDSSGGQTSSDSSSEETVEASTLLKKSEYKFDLINTTRNVRNIYEELKYVIPSTNKQANDLKINIKNSIDLLQTGITNLDKLSKSAEAVCKKQGVGQGKCNSSDYTK